MHPHTGPVVSCLLTLLCTLTLDAPVRTEEEVRFLGAGSSLAGTLVLPDGDGPHPVIILTHGSEPGTRHGYGRYVAPFVEQGLAVFRYDKRGVGDSEGEYVEAPDLRVPCADLLGAVAFLREHPSIAPDHIGVFGASQGGWVAPMAASMSEHIRFVAVQSAPGVSPLEQNLFDKGNRLAADGVEPAEVARATAYRRAYWTYLITGEGFDQAQRLHDAIADQPWFTDDRFPFPFGPREGLLRHPRMRSWAIHNAYEPRLTLERVRVPILTVFGGADRIVPVEASIAAFRAAFEVAGNEHWTLSVFEGADHGIRVDTAGGGREPAPDFLESLAGWAAEQARGEH